MQKIEIGLFLKNSRYPHELCDNSEGQSNKSLCETEVLLEKPNEYGWWIQNSTEHSDGSGT